MAKVSKIFEDYVRGDITRKDAIRRLRAKGISGSRALELVSGPQVSVPRTRARGTATVQKDLWRRQS